MSTRSSIACSDTLHLYLETLEYDKAHQNTLNESDYPIYLDVGKESYNDNLTNLSKKYGHKELCSLLDDLAFNIIKSYELNIKHYGLERFDWDKYIIKHESKNIKERVMKSKTDYEYKNQYLESIRCIWR